MTTNSSKPRETQPYALVWSDAVCRATGEALYPAVRHFFGNFLAIGIILGVCLGRLLLSPVPLSVTNQTFNNGREAVSNTSVSPSNVNSTKAKGCATCGKKSDNLVVQAVESAKPEQKQSPTPLPVSNVLPIAETPSDVNHNQ